MVDTPDETLSEKEVERVAVWLDEQLDEVAGYDVRVDAGEAGRVWIALRGALGDDDAERALLETTRELLDTLPPERTEPFEPRISSGRAEDDLVFICELYRAT